MLLTRLLIVPTSPYGMCNHERRGDSRGRCLLCLVQTRLLSHFHFKGKNYLPYVEPVWEINGTVVPNPHRPYFTEDKNCQSTEVVSAATNSANAASSNAILLLQFLCSLVFTKRGIASKQSTVQFHTLNQAWIIPLNLGEISSDIPNKGHVSTLRVMYQNMHPLLRQWTMFLSVV